MRFFTGMLTATFLVAATINAAPGKTAEENTNSARLQTHRLELTQKRSKKLWCDGTQLTIEGMGWKDADTTYSRLPAKAMQLVSYGVKNLSHHTAGICVRFVSDAPEISAEWTAGGAMRHMAKTGSNGLDLYRKKGKEWEYVATGFPAMEDQGLSSGTLSSKLTPQPTEYMLYLPLYGRVEELKLGIPEGSRICPAQERTDKPIVFYGTSITQGGCASRAGMAHPAILGRWLNRPVINLGFSGSGKMEPVMANLLNELDPSVYVLECLPNMTTESVTGMLEPFVIKLREKHSDTPILLVENPNLKHDAQQNRILQQIYRKLREKKIKGLHYLTSEKQLFGREEGTVDSVHPTDLGFLRMAEAYEPVLKTILEAGK